MTSMSASSCLLPGLFQQQDGPCQRGNRQLQSPFAVCLSSLPLAEGVAPFLFARGNLALVQQVLQAHRLLGRLAGEVEDSERQPPTRQFQSQQAHTRLA